MNHRTAAIQTDTEMIFSDTVTVFEGDVDIKTTSSILSLHVVFSQCKEGNSCIHQDYARVAVQYLFIYSDQTDEPAEMMVTVSDTPHPVANIHEKGSFIRVHVLFYEK